MGSGQRLEQFLENKDFRFQGWTQRWDYYLAFDEALCRQLFDESNSGVPIYLDMDDEVIEAAGSHLNLSGDKFQEGLISAVRGLLILDESGTAVFKNFDTVIKKWARQTRKARLDKTSFSPPPVIGLLAILTLAAERMGDSQNKDIHDNAYYPHLYELLNVSKDDQPRFETSFRKSTERYWDALNLWLEAEDGFFGLPSAYALAHRYIGLPISQALIRDKERRQLKRMFLEMALPAGQSVGHQDMDGALDSWITQSPSPASSALQQLWARVDARSRIADIAIAELEAWDGSTEDIQFDARGSKTNFNKCSLVISDVNDFLSTRIDIGFVLPLSKAALGTVKVETTSGQVDIRVSPIGSNTAGASASAIGMDVESLLTGAFSVVAADETVLTRFPRPIVPLYSDPFSGIWVESERVQIGEFGRILVQDKKSYPEIVNEVLTNTARPGFTITRSPDLGIPDGWVLFSEVQVLTSPSEDARVKADFALNVLMPRLGTRMAFNGGFRFPGRVTRWSSLWLPEVTVTSEDDKPLSVRCISRDVDEEGEIIPAIELQKPTPAPFVINLSEFDLESGDYVFELSVGNKPVQNQSFRVRDSDRIDVLKWREIENLGHFSGHELWPLAASQGYAGQELVVDGASSYGDQTDVEAVPAPRNIRWTNTVDRSVVQATFSVPALPADSCVLTGAHRETLPVAGPGKPTSLFIIGTCKTCGQTKRYPTASWLAEKMKRRNARNNVPVSQGAASRETAEVEALTEVNQNWRPAVDALHYCGHGSARDLAAIARNIHNSASFEHEFQRTVEQLGLIEISRNDSLSPVSFEIAATCLTELATGGIVLTGAWSKSLVDDAFIAAENLGGEIYYNDPENVCLPMIEGVDIHELHAEIGNESLTVVTDAAWHILHRLPALSDLLPSLPRTSMPGWTSIELFDPMDGRWKESNNDQTPGAYRVKNNYQSTYCVRTVEDIASGETVICDVMLAKHLAAQIAGFPLIAFSEDGTLSVPLGAELPGLYGRAATLCGGKRPEPNFTTYSLEYSSVTQEFADALMGRLL